MTHDEILSIVALVILLGVVGFLRVWFDTMRYK